MENSVFDFPSTESSQCCVVLAETCRKIAASQNELRIFECWTKGPLKLEKSLHVDQNTAHV